MSKDPEFVNRRLEFGMVDMSDDEYIDTTYYYEMRMEPELTQEEITLIIQREVTRRFYDLLILGEEPKEDLVLPRIKPWSPYTDIHEKIEGWLNDGS